MRPSTRRFPDRTHAGRELCGRLAEVDLHDPVVLALPRGGIPVAVEVAAALNAPVEVFVVRKVGAPGHEELAVGAVAEGSDLLVVADTARRLGLARSDVQALSGAARAEVSRRVAVYRQDRNLPELGGRDVIVVDDGLATGATAEVALRVLRQRGPSRLILAVPVCAREALHGLRSLADDIVCLLAPSEFRAVGDWYDNFLPTSDAECAARLERARSDVGSPERSPRAWG